MRAKHVSLLKASVFCLGLFPLLRLVWAGAGDDLGANPVEAITRSTGDWTLYFLCITLAVTPLRRLSGWSWPQRLRRMLGLFTFFYALLHFTTFFWFDHFFDLQEMWRDILKRPFITVGFVAFVLLIPLAATSSDAMLHRLGGRRWQLLHRLVYLIAPLAILHFWWMKAGKNDVAEPALFATVVAVLLGLRVVWAFQKRRVQTRQAAPAVKS